MYGNLVKGDGCSMEMFGSEMEGWCESETGIGCGMGIHFFYLVNGAFGLRLTYSGFGNGCKILDCRGVESGTLISFWDKGDPCTNGL